MVELTIGRAGGWFYPLYRRVGCRRWRWLVVNGQAVRFGSEQEVERFLGAVCAGLGSQGWYCCLLLAA